MLDNGLNLGCGEFLPETGQGIAPDFFSTSGVTSNPKSSGLSNSETIQIDDCQNNNERQVTCL